jgi:transcriptional regulator with XRE-family HTH domain
MNRIKTLREDFGYTQQELADKLNGAKSTIAMYENETRKPSLEILVKLSEIFNCSIDYLLCKTDIRNSGQQIDDVLNEAMIGMSKADYEKLTETQKKQIRDFAIFVKNQVEGDKK